MSKSIKVYKRTIFGAQIKIAEYAAWKYEMVVSTHGVLTIRELGERKSILTLNNDEWSKAVEV